MGGNVALIAEVFRCLDQTDSKELLPKTIDGHAGGQRIAGVDEPLGQVHSRRNLT